MRGSAVSNINLDPEKQKLIQCMDCGIDLVVGKFTKNIQNCETAGYKPSNCKKTEFVSNKKKSARDKIAEQKLSIVPNDDGFGSKMRMLMSNLGFEIDHNRRYKKKFAVDGGAICTIYPYVEQGMADEEPRVEYFSMIVQRAVGVNEDFRKFMPPDAASDCELIASELGLQVEIAPQIGMQKCDKCGDMTDEFGVDPAKGKVFCIKPNNCFMKNFNNAGAEAS